VLLAVATKPLPLLPLTPTCCKMDKFVLNKVSGEHLRLLFKFEDDEDDDDEDEQDEDDEFGVRLKFDCKNCKLAVVFVVVVVGNEFVVEDEDDDDDNGDVDCNGYVVVVVVEDDELGDV
jgi:hypothetical protein